jgi:hypothetical protein
MIRAISIVTHEPELLPKIRELYSRLPETRFAEPWELQHHICSLGYSDGLVSEAEISAAVEVARTDWMPDEGAA